MDRPIPYERQRGRRVTARAGKGQSRPQRQHPPPNCKQAPSCSQVFLGSWTLDICQEGCSQRSAPQRRHMAHVGRCSHYAPRKPSGWDRGGDKTHCTPEECAQQAPRNLSCSDLGRAQNAGPTKYVPFWSTQELEPEQLRPGKCIQPQARLRQFPEEQPKA